MMGSPRSVIGTPLSVRVPRDISDELGSCKTIVGYDDVPGFQRILFSKSEPLFLHTLDKIPHDRLSRHQRVTAHAVPLAVGRVGGADPLNYRILVHTARGIFGELVVAQVEAGLFEDSVSYGLTKAPLSACLLGPLHIWLARGRMVIHHRVSRQAFPPMAGRVTAERYVKQEREHLSAA